MNSFNHNTTIVAARTTKTPLVSAGINKHKQTILFRSEDYDNNGRVNGIYQLIGENTDKFHQCTGNYSKEAIRELGWDEADIITAENEVEHFKNVTQRPTEQTKQFLHNQFNSRHKRPVDFEFSDNGNGSRFTAIYADGKRVPSYNLDVFPMGCSGNKFKEYLSTFK